MTSGERSQIGSFMLPEVDGTIGAFEQRQHPFFATFLTVLLHRLHEPLGRELLVVAHDVLELEALSRLGDEMNMITHDAPRIELQSLRLLAMGQTLDHDVLIDGPAQRIDPANDRVAQEVQIFLVMAWPRAPTRGCPCGSREQASNRGRARIAATLIRANGREHSRQRGGGVQ